MPHDPRQTLAWSGELKAAFVPLVLPFCFQQAMVGGQGHSLMPEREAVVVVNAGREFVLCFIFVLCFNHGLVVPLRGCRRQEDTHRRP